MARLSRGEFESIGRVLGEPRRYEILRQIGAAGIETCVAIQRKQFVSPATLSHHIKALKLSNLVRTIRVGKFLHLSVNRTVLRAYLNQLAEI
jgi:ArsR family transcriptional regulator